MNISAFILDVDCEDMLILVQHICSKFCRQTKTESSYVFLMLLTRNFTLNCNVLYCLLSSCFYPVLQMGKLRQRG